MTESKQPESCCGPATATSCCDESRDRKLDIEFLYLDLSVCERCQGTESTLEEAIVEVARILELTGVEISLRKTHVTSEEQAVSLGFLVSPTIRLNGRDIQMNFRESPCDSCGTLCNCEGGVSCREWEYWGEWHTAPPKGLIVEAIMREVYGGAGVPRGEPATPDRAPENLQRFFSSRK